MTARRVLVLTVLALALLVPGSVFAADVTGKWAASFDTQIGKQEYTYEFKVAGTQLTGKAKSANGESDLVDGKVNGDTVTFVENLNYQGMALRIEYTGKVVSADEIQFSRKVADIATETLVAKRAK